MSLYCQDKGVWSFLSFLSKIETELKIVKAIFFDPSQGGLVGIEQIENPIRNRIIKEAWNPKNGYERIKFSLPAS